MKRFRRTSTLAVCLPAVSSALLAGCGDGESPTADPEVVLEEASVAASAIRSGEIDVQADLEISADELSQSEGLSLEGTFTRQSGGPPQFDLEATLAQGSASGPSEADFKLIAAATTAYLESGEKVYEVAPAAFERYESLFGVARGPGGGGSRGLAVNLDPAGWFIDPSNEGTESIEDTDVVHVSGTADVEQLASELNAVAVPLGLAQTSEFSGIDQTFDEATIDLYAGVEDGVPRRVEVELRWNGRLEGGVPFQGVIDVLVSLSEIDQPQEIEAPEMAQPLGGSVEDLPPQLSGLGEFLSSPVSSSDLADAQAFDDHTLYYLGSSFHGLPLTFSGLGPGSGAGQRRAWSFIYGDCTPSGGDAPSCAPPLEVQNWSICSRFPALYPGPTPKTTPANGAETLPAGGGLDVYTGRTTVVIFGADRAAVIRSLTPVGDTARPNELPPPAPGSLEGKLPCQADRLDRFSR